MCSMLLCLLYAGTWHLFAHGVACKTNASQKGSTPGGLQTLCHLAREGTVHVACNIGGSRWKAISLLAQAGTLGVAGATCLDSRPY